MQQITPKSGFRRDINGLRAWAVVAVILYHFEVRGFAGGFVGVDIFFVISGFLMTGIITEGLARNDFSIFGFYLARAKRIVPALAVLCGVLLAGGWVFLQAPDYKKLASHTVYSLSFLSNVEYWQEAGYFDAASHEKWLLHTWSLSVEWQFYLILPIVLSAIWKFRQNRTTFVRAVFSAAIVSLVLCVIFTKKNPSAAFFLLSSRAWEMLAGSLVYLLSERVVFTKRSGLLVNNAGLAMIVAAIAFFDRTSAWPGLNALLPVAAASLVLLANQASVWTYHPVAQWLGDRSYSLYLWHWPIYVALVFSELRSSAVSIAGGLVLTILLGHLSYIFIEKHSRSWLGRRKSMAAAVPIVTLAVFTMAPALLVWGTQGWPGRFSTHIENIALEAKNINSRRAECHTTVGTKPSGCNYGTGSGRLIVLGDSHADAVITGISSVLKEHDTKVEQMSYSGCPFVNGLKLTEAILGRQPRDYNCTEFIKTVGFELSSKYQAVPVIIVNRYASAALGSNEHFAPRSAPSAYFSKKYSEASEEYIDEFSKAIVATACELARKRPVYLMRPIPEMGVNVPKTLSRRVSFGMDAELSIGLDEYWRRNGWVWKAQDLARDSCGVKILDPIPYLCSNGRCYGSKNGRPLYYDDDHLSEYGNKLLVPMYREAFKNSGLLKS